MRQGLLYVFAAGALVLMVSVAWWTRERLAAETVTVTTLPGDTIPQVAAEHQVRPAALAEANGMEVSLTPIPPGTELTIPASQPSTTQVWLTHLVGLSGTVLGVFMSLWLSMVAGLLPRPIRRQVLGISLVLGIVSYATTYAVIQAEVLLTPTFLFAAIKDGFAWAAAFPLLARAMGIREEPPPGAAVPEPLPAAAPPPVADAALPPSDA